MKNLGSGIATSGGYIVGTKKCIDLIADRLTVPGVGKNLGANFGVLINYYKGLFHAPRVVSGALKTQIDKVKGDMSVVTVVIEYICVYIITFVLGFKIASDLASISVLITLVIVAFVEILILLIITSWNFLRVFLKKTTSPIIKNKNK